MAKNVSCHYCKHGIVMLLMWKMLIYASHILRVQVDAKIFDNQGLESYIYVSVLYGSYFIAPLIGWITDARVGRYQMLINSVLLSFVGNVLVSVSQFMGGMAEYILCCITSITESVIFVTTLITLLPFLTDQLIGATADELSATIYWYYWVEIFMNILTQTILCFLPNSILISQILLLAGSTAILALFISDCLCQQWLDRTHKVSNPIKLIFQVLNYARKNSYPRRRSAFTYLDEEQPSRIDLGKDNKFGGPFTEEEVEDVKTVLRMIPLVACISFSVSTLWIPINIQIFQNPFSDCKIYNTILYYAPILLLIPFYQFLIYPLFHKWVPTMLRRIGIGLFLQLLGFIGCIAIAISDACSDGLKGYLNCTTINSTGPTPVYKLAPLLVHYTGEAMAGIFILEFIMVQSPDKMKGLVFGVYWVFYGLNNIVLTILQAFFSLSICYDAPVSTLLTLLFLVFLFFSKRYTLRERNRVVNIQAIAEEHYERYLDQEEEYMKQQHY